MKVSVKTLKGEQFVVEVENSDTIGDVKRKIEQSKSELAADRQKLIHAGKVLLDDMIVADSGIKENEYIVCMVTAAKKPVSTTPAPSTTTSAPVQQQPVQTQPIPQQQNPPPIQSQPIPQAAPVISDKAVADLIEMGFVEADVRAALRAARGNSQLAVEYLMSGHIPEERASSQQQHTHAPASGNSAQPGSLEQLRHHPQLNSLKALVQQNPAALSQVLESIGQQNPDLLRAIHANQADFLALMNEPIVNAPPQPPAQQFGDFGGDFGDEEEGDGDYGDDGMGGMGNPAQLMQMLQMLNAMPPEQRAAAAAQMGMTPEQLAGITQMMASMPPAQMQAMLSGAMGGAAGAGRQPGGGAGNVIRLSEEEMQAVARLQELGFSQQEAAQAYLACDKNEQLAANFLLNGGGGGDW